MRLTRTGSGRQCIMHDNDRLLTASRQTESHRNKRDLETVQIYFGMGDIWESFLKNMQVRTKYAEKTC
ncbi:hypothetical protein MTR_5g014075 [Medicago truncatula]|uniref:Uncharacterized protein n=1 Tax=Medicago truncatula TaxID=3880 RepID=A0A072UCZ8_MEDTR|nr:hypothetical protein MTR_5g014075 [Medicago truncatula]